MKRKKKIQGCIFFSPEKVHEAFIQDVVGFSLFFLKVGCVFFFPSFCVFFLCFFFSCKSSHAIHSIDLEAVFFFFRRWKKKYSFFIHSINFASKCEKNELLQEKKNTIPLAQPNDSRAAVWLSFWFSTRFTRKKLDYSNASYLYRIFFFL